jgi:hypothetical protein
VVLSFLADERAQADEAFGKVWNAHPQRAQYLLSRLLLKKCENLVISPRVFDTFGDDQKEAIRNYYERNTLGHEYESDDPRLSLFCAVA